VTKARFDPAFQSTAGTRSILVRAAILLYWKVAEGGRA